MTDIFARSNQRRAQEAIREQDKAYQEALTEAAKRRVAEAAERAKRPINGDIGYKAPKKFFELIG